MGCKWGFFHEYVLLTSPWRWADFKKQRKRWLWGNIHAITHRDVLPLWQAVIIAAKYMFGCTLTIISFIAAILRLMHLYVPPPHVTVIFWLSLGHLAFRLRRQRVDQQRGGPARTRPAGRGAQTLAAPGLARGGGGGAVPAHVADVGLCLRDRAARGKPEALRGDSKDRAGRDLAIGHELAGGPVMLAKLRILGVHLLILSIVAVAAGAASLTFGRVIQTAAGSALPAPAGPDPRRTPDPTRSRRRTPGCHLVTTSSSAASQAAVRVIMVTPDGVSLRAGGQPVQVDQHHARPSVTWRNSPRSSRTRPGSASQARGHQRYVRR